MRRKLIKEIKELKKKQKAVILAHNYQIGEVQDIADFTGDSLELSRKAAQTGAEVIVFCGVRFMAETAAILSPQKKVLLPVKGAGCPLADMATAEQVEKEKERHPKAAVVCYVNSSAEVKAISDLVCTSANAIEVVNSLPQKEIIFLPDKNLGSWVSLHTDKQIILWDGHCYVHTEITKETVLQTKQKHPQAMFFAHPECNPEVLELADEVLSTGGMLKTARRTICKEIIIGTEQGLLHRLGQENPEKGFYLPKKNIVCRNMKLTTLWSVRDALRDFKYEIKVPEGIREKAEQAIKKMMEIG